MLKIRSLCCILYLIFDIHRHRESRVRYGKGKRKRKRVLIEHRAMKAYWGVEV
jgi:hypothetical protein